MATSVYELRWPETPTLTILADCIRVILYLCVDDILARNPTLATLTLLATRRRVEEVIRSLAQHGALQLATQDTLQRLAD